MRKIVSASAAALLAGVTALALGAQPVELTLDPTTVLNGIDVKIYGHFLEHIYHSCNGGLWGDLIWDRSFEGPGVGEDWSISEGRLVQRGAGSDVRLLFGDREWADYELTLEARKTGGEEGFLILVRAQDHDQFYWANLGGWGNVGHALERGVRGQGRWHPVTPRKSGRIETGRWYSICIRCQGRRIQAWLDDDLVIDYTDDGQGARRGRAGVGTWLTQAQFRNLKVTALDGRVLFHGLPELPDRAAALDHQWHVFGPVSVTSSTDDPLNASTCRRVTCQQGFGGLMQGPIAVRDDEAYRGSIWARGRSAGGIAVSLTDGSRRLAEQVLPSPSREWQEFPVELRPAANCDHAVLRIGVHGESEVWLDQVSLMPESWRRQGGFRADLLRAIAALQPPVIRWPGGCFASSYQWKQGIGPQHNRLPHPRAIWDDLDTYSLGTDEFIALCRAVGAEPLIVINMGTPNWNKDAGDHDYLQDALDWLEYCNGPPDSTWGRVRATNGHAQPYAVKYWELDNETWHMGAGEYSAWVRRFATAMRKQDPSIRLAACGSAGYGDGDRGLGWNRVVIDRCADLIDYLSIHHYENPNRFAEGPRAYERFFRKNAKLIVASKNARLKLYVSEWNAQSTDWRTGLHCGAQLNAFESCGDVVEMAGPALLLRHTSATKWDNAFINFDHRTWFPAPNYVVMKLWREHYAPERIAIDGDAGDLSAVASRSAEGRNIHLKLVNPTAEAVAVAVRLKGRAPVGNSLQVVAPGSLAARNTLETPHAVTPRPAPVQWDGDAMKFSMPAWSCGVLAVKRR